MEKVMKKLLFLMTVILCLAALLVSCSEPAGPGTEPPVSPEPTVVGDSAVIFSSTEAFTLVSSSDDSTAKLAVNMVTEAATALSLKLPATAVDTEKSETKCELVVGNTVRAISAKAKAALQDKIAAEPDAEHWIWLYDGGQLALYANSESAYASAVEYLKANYYADGSVKVKTDASDIGYVAPDLPYTEPVISGDYALVFGESEAFTVIYNAKDSVAGESLANGIVSAVKGMGLKAPKIGADKKTAEAKCELIIGDTARFLSDEAKDLLEIRIEQDPDGLHWIWLYEDGQLALYANSAEAYEKALAELSDKYQKNGKVMIKTSACDLGRVATPHAAAMSYTIPKNFYDGYIDPFRLSEDEYVKTTVTLMAANKYTISYTYENGGIYETDFVKNIWGVWVMGTIRYTDASGKTHIMTNSQTDYEYVFKIGSETPVTFRGGNHGNYPSDSSWAYYVDDTSYNNDRMLDMTLYDGKTGEKLTFTRINESKEVNGLRVVLHHNVYEKNYVQENILLTCERSYLFNGTDIHLDTQIYVAKDVNFGRSFSCMMPVVKEYGNCVMLYREDGSSVYMKTAKDIGTKNEQIFGVEATVIDVWGEDHPECHIIIKVNNPEDQYMNSTNDKEGYAGVRDMNGGPQNKIYCSFFSETGTLSHNDELHFNTTWSFSLQEDFKNPDRTPDHYVGIDG